MEEDKVPVPPPPTVVKPRKKRAAMSAKRKQWLCLTYSLTWCIPSFFLSCCGKMRNPQVRLAWREKVTICLLILFLSLGLLFLLIGFGPVICPRQNVLSVSEINAYTDMSDPIAYAYGRTYKLGQVITDHFNSYNVPNYYFQNLLGQDVSSLFYKQNSFSDYCPGLDLPESSWDNLANRPKNPVYKHRANNSADGTQKMYLEYMNQYESGRVVWPLSYIEKFSSAKLKLIVINQNVYDVSAYFNSQVQFMGPAMQSLFANYYGKDASKQWAQVVNQDDKAPLYLNCMNNLFYIGVLDQRQSLRCQVQNYILLGFTILLCFVISMKFFAALRCQLEVEPEVYDRFVVINVPIYSEGADSIRSTLNSISKTKYPASRKLLFLVVDGIVVGSGNDINTATLLLEILGIDPSGSSRTPLLYESLGEGSELVNRAEVFSGIFQGDGEDIPFIVVLKIGNEGEVDKPGNRGKRDSQLILLRFLSRANYMSPMSPLEIELMKKFLELDMPPDYFEYVLMIDADTTIFPDSLNHLVATMIHDSEIIGLCGETLISNDQQSWVTMIQVYEYFISHHLAKAFESLFGSVTCLPGCFCMYRLKTTKGKPLIISSKILKEYSLEKVDTLHLKNLLMLGEDRYLTTLMLASFPYSKVCFNVLWSLFRASPNAKQLCLTNGAFYYPKGVDGSIAQWQQIAWMLVYLLAMPFTGFFIPLYSFWHFDDFSWGSTRKTMEEVDVEESEERQGITLQAFPNENEQLVSEEVAKVVEEQSAFSKVMNWKIGGGSSASSSAYTSRKVGSVASGAPFHLRNGHPKEMRFQKPRKEPSVHSNSQSTADRIQVSRPFPTDTEILTELRCILNDQNLEETSRKELRLELERRFGFDLTEKKDLIYGELSKML